MSGKKGSQKEGEKTPLLTRGPRKVSEDRGSITRTVTVEDYEDADDSSPSGSDIASSYSIQIETGKRASTDPVEAEHCHVSRRGIKKRKKHQTSKAKRQLIIASAICVLFMIGEFVGGYIANSLAIMTDSAHLLSDFAGFMISLLSLWVASRPATKKMSFGYYRAEVMGALLSVLIIWVLTGILVFLAVQRVITGDYEVNGKVMAITAGAGVGVNLIMGFVLHQGGHGHSHGGGSHTHGGHGHAHNGKDKENVNVRAAFIHVLGDFIQSIGVLIAALIILFKPEWEIADPICTFIFSIVVLVTTLTIIKDAVFVLMEGVPHGLDFTELKESLVNLDGVKTIHDLHIWSLTMGTTALSVHIAIEEGHSSQSVLDEATTLVAKKYDIQHSTIQVETFQEDMKDCSQCQDPVD